MSCDVLASRYRAPYSAFEVAALRCGLVLRGDKGFGLGKAVKPLQIFSGFFRFGGVGICEVHALRQPFAIAANNGVADEFWLFRFFHDD